MSRFSRFSPRSQLLNRCCQPMQSTRGAEAEQLYCQTLTALQAKGLLPIQSFSHSRPYSAEDRAGIDFRIELRTLRGIVIEYRQVTCSRRGLKRHFRRMEKGKTPFRPIDVVRPRQSVQSLSRYLIRTLSPIVQQAA